MKFTDIPWGKKHLLVFFGKDVERRVNQICDLSNKNEYTDIVFPEHGCFHPWEHVKILEITTMAINHHPDILRFVVITNSAYIIDHLANLMKGARLNPGAKYTRLKTTEAFIAKEKVGAYVCSGGKIKNALPRAKDKEIIEWGDLSEVAEWLSEIYFEMEP